MLPYFLWGGYDSRDMGIIINEYPPLIKPKARVTELTIPGRSGTLTVTEAPGIYESVVLPVQCTMLPGTDIGTISAWLSGSGTLVFGDYPTRSYRARIDAQISFDKILRGHAHRSFAVPFVCQPGRYLYPEAANITLGTNPQTITSTASMDSLPQIKLTGTGTVTLTVGAYTLEMVDLDPLVPVLIDSEAMTVTNVALSASYISDMTGSFPKLVLGDNVISHTGTVASVVIKPRYRWL